MDEQGAFCLGGGCQVGGCGGVDEVGYFFIVFCGIYIGVGGAVHNGTHALGGFQHSCGICDVELHDIGEDEFMLCACLCCHAAHFIAQLTVGTCYEYLHIQ